jgi:RNA polymerase sigma-70 factor (ECF subfamily)
MDDNDVNQRLSRITTHWSMLLQAHQGQIEDVSAAQHLLLQRYGGAVYRYLLGMLRDPDAAEDLAQEFALRFLRGDFRRADPQRGRFRDFLKMALRHLVVDYHRRQQARPQPLPVTSLALANAAANEADFDRQFLVSWRKELLNHAWEALARIEQETGQPFHTVLRFRAEHPDLRSAQMAEQLAVQQGKAVTAEWVRKILERARGKFADCLLDDVAHSLDHPSTDQLEEELLDLGLLDYCRPALQRRRRG